MDQLFEPKIHYTLLYKGGNPIPKFNVEGGGGLTRNPGGLEL